MLSLRLLEDGFEPTNHSTIEKTRGYRDTRVFSGQYSVYYLYCCLEQLVITDPAHFIYPIWPPPIAVDAIHCWGRTFDPVLLARPAWWKVTIWIDALFFGPFYIVAIYAYIKDCWTPEKIGE